MTSSKIRVLFSSELGWLVGLGREPDGVNESVDGVGDELQLRLELGVVGGEAVAGRARAPVLRVVGRGRAARVAAPEVVFPKFCFKNNMSLVTSKRLP
jgi:hypothetical protein